MDSATGLLMVFLSAVGIMFTVASGGMEIKDPVEDLTCDELAFEIVDHPNSSFHEQDIYHKKCIPDELKRASLLEIAEYLSKLDCNELANHIVKRHFEPEQAQLIYKFKCGDPANINFESLEITFEKSPRTEITHEQPKRGRN